MRPRGRWRIGLWLVLLATAVRLCWMLSVPTIPVGDFATYRESAIYLAELGHLDTGFVYMPGLVALLAVLHLLGGDLLAAKMVGVLLGGLAAGAVFVVAARLIDNGEGGPIGQLGPIGPRRQLGQPVALVAGLSYALWPAGIAMSSVIGTDIPTAAIILGALALLCVLGDSRPWLASVAFGAVMGVAAYFRAVALPLTGLAAVYWLARRAGWRATLGRTAVAIAVTVLVLFPWGLRNWRQGGEFTLTDNHGGITALMGNDPNTEGTYSRSLSTTFRELTGRTFLMQPHRQTDQVAYRLARQFMAFDPTWTVGMIALRLERLFAPERGLLYWSVYRPGVVPPATAAWFNQHRPLITGLADWSYLLFGVCVCAGLAFAVSERRWAVLVPLPFALALVATYALFVAEPRYRITTEALLFPLVGFGACRLVGGLGAAARAATARADRQPGQQSVLTAEARRGLAGTLLVVALLTAAGLTAVLGGKSLRSRHRWAATVWQVDGHAQLALWSAAGLSGGPSPVRPAPPGSALVLGRGQRQASARIFLPAFAPAAGSIQLSASLRWRGVTLPTDAVVSLGGVMARAGAPAALGRIEHPSGPLHLDVRLERAPGGAAEDAVEVMVSDVVLTTAQHQAP